MPDSCTDLMTDEQVSEAMGGDWATASQPASIDSLPGPLARAAAESATATLACLWWPVLQGDVFLPLYVFELSETARATLISGIRNSPSYTETTVDGELAFTSSFADEMFSWTVRYIFIDDLWIALVAPVFPEQEAALVDAALAAVRP